MLPLEFFAAPQPETAATITTPMRAAMQTKPLTAAALAVSCLDTSPPLPAREVDALVPRAGSAQT